MNFEAYRKLRVVLYLNFKFFVLFLVGFKFQNNNNNFVKVNRKFA